MVFNKQLNLSNRPSFRISGVTIVSLLASYLNNIKPSPTLSLAKKAKELKAQGVDVLNISVGEPDVDTPQNIKDAAIAAIKSGKTKYTAVDGIPELKNAILQKYSPRYQGIKPSNIIVSCGAKHVIYGCFMATINEGDEVIIPAPFWVSYPDMVEIARGTPVIVECHETNDFKLTPALLEKGITKKSKWLVINSPSNPTGVKYTKEELKALATIIKNYPDLYVMSDDIYEDMVYGDSVYSLIDVAPEIADRIFVVNGVSKAYSMTGWRIGYGIGDERIIKYMETLQSQSTSNPCSISQYAALEALVGDQSSILSMVKDLEERRNLSHKLLTEIEGITCIKPQGAFYLFPNCSSFFGKKLPDGSIINNDSDFCNYMLNEAKVAITPGSAFGLDGYFRFSYTVPRETIVQATERIKLACAILK